MRKLARCLGFLARLVGWFVICLAVIVVAAAAKGIRFYVGSDQTSLIVDLASEDGHRAGARHYTILYCNYLTLHGIKTGELTSAADTPLDRGCAWYERAPGMPAALQQSYFQEW